MTDLELFKQALREATSQRIDEVIAAAPVIDPTGIELKPGDPTNCAGMDECCDECDYVLDCFPEYDKENDEEEEETFYTLLRYKCKRCGFELERRYKSPEAYGGGMMTCTCGAFGLDPHPLWPGVTWRNDVDPHVDLEEYFETEPVNKPTC